VRSKDFRLLRLLYEATCLPARNPRTQLVTLGRPRVGARSTAVVRLIELGEVGVVSSASTPPSSLLLSGRRRGWCQG